MKEYKKEEIRNIHYNNKNEIQFEYGGQVHHYRIENLKEVFINCWNLQQENKQLKERIAYLERSNNRREDTILEQRQEISDLEDNWNMLKEFIDTLWLDDKGIVTKIKDKIELIEQGDSNVKEKED